MFHVLVPNPLIPKGTTPPAQTDGQAKLTWHHPDNVGFGLFIYRSLRLLSKPCENLTNTCRLALPPCTLEVFSKRNVSVPGYAEETEYTVHFRPYSYGNHVLYLFETDTPQCKEGAFPFPGPFVMGHLLTQPLRIQILIAISRCQVSRMHCNKCKINYLKIKLLLNRRIIKRVAIKILCTPLPSIHITNNTQLIVGSII